MNSWSPPPKNNNGGVSDKWGKNQKSAVCWISRCSHHVLLSCTASSKGPKLPTMCWSQLLFCITLQQLSCYMPGTGCCEKDSGRWWVCFSKVFNGLDYHQHTDMMNPGKKICRLDHYPDMMIIQVSKTCSITRPSISQTTTSLVMMSPTCLHKFKLSLPPPFVTHSQGFHTVCWYGIHLLAWAR